MGMGDFHRHRRLSGVMALVGVLLYVALIPGHVVSQALSGSLASMQGTHAGDAGADEPICHRMMGGAKDPAAPGSPTAPHKKCPFCTGYASFHAGLAACTAVLIVAVEPASPTLAGLDAAIMESAVRHPQNRGPPLEL